MRKSNTSTLSDIYTSLSVSYLVSFLKHLFEFLQNTSKVSVKYNQNDCIEGKGDHSEIQDKFRLNFQNMLIRSL